ncbi:MAG: ABC transporter substrate-binding protein [Rhodothermales bacterium]
MKTQARRFALYSFTALLLAGCGGSSGEQQTVDESQVEVFSWWTSGGEAAALEAVFDAYHMQYPDVEVINASIAGGGGSAARPVLQTRLIGNNPPDTWQTHPGSEVMSQYVVPGFAQPLGDLYEEEGWYDVFPQALIDMVSRDGVPHLVILNLHRSNTLWYNKPLLDRHGITVGEALSHDDLFALAEQLQAAAVTPLCMGDAGIWATGIMFENTLTGVIGPQRYLGLWDGSTSFEDPDVKAAIVTYGRLLDYLNNDHAALSWDQAAKKLIDGGCAFYSMGDWVYGEFVDAGLEENIDFGWVAHPGTEETYLMVSDGFTLAKGAPHPEYARNMLRVMGQKEVQEDFNVLKGSICARTDCDRSRFGAYLNWAMDTYENATLVPTVIHGSAAAADFQQALNDALTSFVVDRDADAFARTLAREARMSGFGK